LTNRLTKRRERRSDEEYANNIESLSKELPEYGWEALISTIDDEKVLISALLRDAIWCRKD
jgi:hypothetical protein